MTNIQLSEVEALTLAGRMEHSPHCVWSEGPVLSFVTPDGKKWSDEECTIPAAERPCTCGYFANLDRARAKLISAIDAPVERSWIARLFRRTQ